MNNPVMSDETFFQCPYDHLAKFTWESVKTGRLTLSMQRIVCLECGRSFVIQQEHYPIASDLGTGSIFDELIVGFDSFTKVYEEHTPTSTLNNLWSKERNGSIRIHLWVGKSLTFVLVKDKEPT